MSMKMDGFRMDASHRAQTFGGLNMNMGCLATRALQKLSRNKADFKSKCLIRFVARFLGRSRLRRRLKSLMLDSILQ